MKIGQADSKSPISLTISPRKPYPTSPRFEWQVWVVGGELLATFAYEADAELFVTAKYRAMALEVTR